MLLPSWMMAAIVPTSRSRRKSSSFFFPQQQQQQQSMITFLIALILLASFQSVQADDKVIFTKEVAYCSTGRAVNTDRFDIRYYPGNNSIGFDISARSVAANLNADLNIELYAYGKNYINITANLCDILAGALCPLPQYQFDGSFAYILPSSVDINLPGIAFTVPDLDAYAQIVLINQETGAEALCLGATLSNGNTVYMNSVTWASAGILILAFVGMLLHSFWPISPYKSGPEWRFATILTYFQHIALCGFLSLDYPLVYKNYTFNFIWSQGLIYARPINDAINRMRYSTGGRNVEGQTYNIIAENNALFTNLSRTATTDADGTSARSYAATASQHYTVPQVQAAPSYNLVSGIETSTQQIGITYANAFMTVFIFFLLFCAVMLAIFLLATAGVAIYSMFKHKRTGAHNLRYFIWTNSLRVLLASYTPLILFIFWQFLHKPDSGWLAIFIASIVFVWIHLAIFGIYWHLSKIAHRSLNNPDTKVSLRWSTVTSQFKKSGQGYLILLAVAAFCSAAFVAFAQGHALVQLVPLIVIELIVFIAFITWRPFANRWSNVLMIFISLFKIVSYGLLLAFYSRLSYNGIIKAVLGFVILAVQSIMVLILFFVTIYNLFVGILWGRGARDRAIAEHRTAMSEKQEKFARPFLHPRTTGLDLRNEDYEAQRAHPTDYDTAFPNNDGQYGNGGDQQFGGGAPPVSSLYIPDNQQQQQQQHQYQYHPQEQGQGHGHGQGFDAPIFPGQQSRNGIDSPSLSDDRTVVADSGEGPFANSSSDLGTKKRTVKGLFSRNR